MTKLLVSVRNAEEALIAAGHGADIVDVKEPTRGALGFASSDVIAKIVSALQGNVDGHPSAAYDLPISIAMGELAGDSTCRWRQRLPEDVWTGIQFAKIACHDCAVAEWPSRWDDWQAALPRHVLPVAVSYADHDIARSPQPEELLDLAAEGGAAAFLLDTFDKKSSHVFDFFSVSQLQALIHRAHELGPMVAVAGSLGIDDLSRVLAANPDVIGVRGAACRGDRDSHICARNVKQLAIALNQS
jgi:uncharacterized protein (UPF0264 family)